MRLVVAALGGVLLVGSAQSTECQTATEIETALGAAHATYESLQDGKNADHIPALAAVDSNIYGIALVTTDGRIYAMGDGVTTGVSGTTWSGDLGDPPGSCSV